jgi:hypothetical protein
MALEVLRERAMSDEHWFGRPEPRSKGQGIVFALPLAGRTETTDADFTDGDARAPAGPTQKAALDGAFVEQFKVLFSQLCNGLTTGLPKPDPRAATDRFATGLQAARAAYEIASKLIG